jgi:excisionase family DNA binding protein
MKRESMKRTREQVMTVKDACEKLQVTTVTIQRWLRAGKLRGSKTTAGWRITEGDVDAFLNRYKNEVIDNDATTD